jgi:hypothetical protein
MKVLVFSLLIVFFASSFIFSETLTSAQVDEIVRFDRIRANTEKSIILTTGRLVEDYDQTKAGFYINFMRAYAWVMNDMNEGSYTVYNLSTFWRNKLRSTGLPLNTISVTGSLAAFIIGNNEKYGEEGLVQTIALFHFADEKADVIEDWKDPAAAEWIKQSRVVVKKILTLANQF